MKNKTKQNKPKLSTLKKEEDVINLEPPLGIMPEWLWQEHRMYDVIGAIDRYVTAGVKTPGAWICELHRRTGEVVEKMACSGQQLPDPRNRTE